MSNEKSSGYNNTPITAKIKKTTQGGMKVEQPLIGSYAPVQMNSPAKNIIVRGGTQLVKAGAKRFLPGAYKAGQKIINKGTKAAKNFISGGGGKAAQEFVPKKSLAQRATKFIRNAVTGGIGYAAIGAGYDYLFGDDDKPATEGTTTTTPPKIEVGQSGPRKPYVKPGGKATGKMKDYKIGSTERYNEYEARGWKQDDTTKGGKPRKKAVPVATELKAEKIKTTKPKVEVPKISIETKAPSKEPSTIDKYVAKKKTKAGNRKLGKAADKQKQADEAAAAGNTSKARRKQRAADRKTRKAKKKFSQAAGSIGITDSPAPKKKNKY